MLPAKTAKLLRSDNAAEQLGWSGRAKSLRLVTGLPIEIWFHTNPCTSDTNFETVLLNLLPTKTLILLDRGFYHFQFFEQLINQNVDFITQLKAKASIKVLKVFTYDYSIKDKLIQLGTGRDGALILTL